MATHANFQHTPNKISHSLAVSGQLGKREPNIKWELAWVPRFGEKRNKIQGKKSCE
jgi:hypothetical protein